LAKAWWCFFLVVVVVVVVVAVAVAAVIGGGGGGRKEEEVESARSNVESRRLNFHQFLFFDQSHPLEPSHVRRDVF